MRVASLAPARLVAVALVAAAGAQELSRPAASQAPVAQFTSRVDLVTFDVSVLDGERRPVRGLTASDFTILENGVPQNVQAFSAIDLPDVETVSAPWVREVAPDVTQNDDLADRRVIAIVLDDSLPMASASLITYAKKAASAVVNQMGPRDMAAVVFALDKSNGQDFTSDRARLLKAIERYTGNAGFTSGDSPGNVATRTQFLYKSMLSTVRVLTQYLSELPERRKALILVSEGIPLDVDAMMPQIAWGQGAGAFSWPELLGELHDTFVAAQRANLNIYPIDPGGLRVTPSLTVDFLRGLAETTGGFAVVDTNDTTGGIRQIFRENGSYYLLGYAPSNAKLEGRFRKIQVKVTRPGLTVRSRSGYFEPEKPKPASKTTPSAIWKALSSPMPRGDVAMRAMAAPFAVPDRREAAVVIVAGLQQSTPPGTGRVVENAELIANAYDPMGSRRGTERLRVRVVLKPEHDEQLVYEVFSRLSLPAGRYQLRLAASSSIRGKSGSVFVDLDVPDFSKAALSMSGVLVSAESGPAAAPKDKLAGLVPVVPTTRREFRGDDRVSAFARIYQGGRNAAVRVSINSQIVDGRGAVVFDRTEAYGPDRFVAGRTADYRLSLPISDVAPGMYLLTINAQAGKIAVSRDIQFSVR